MNTFWNYWGKARPVEGSAAAFHLLPYHCLDVAAVGTAYLDAAPGLRRWLTSEIGAACEKELVAWVSFWLCLHDLGKFSEAFQSQRAELFEHLRGRPPRNAYNERHDTLGRVAWTKVVEQTALDEAWLGPQTIFRASMPVYVPGLPTTVSRPSRTTSVRGITSRSRTTAMPSWRSFAKSNSASCTLQNLQARFENTGAKFLW